jgi:hypothetical protein
MVDYLPIEPDAIVSGWPFRAVTYAERITTEVPLEWEFEKNRLYVLPCDPPRVLVVAIPLNVGVGLLLVAVTATISELLIRRREIRKLPKP